MPRLRGCNPKLKSKMSKTINKVKKPSKKEQMLNQQSFQQKVLADELASMEPDSQVQQSDSEIQQVTSAFDNVAVNQRVSVERNEAIVPASLKQGDMQMQDDG